MAALRLPTRRFRGLLHVGDLRKPPPKRSSSWEGPGLSVSLAPDAWREIARVGGCTWVLRRGDRHAGALVDFHALGPRRKAVLVEMAEAQDLGRRATIWQHCVYDDELGDERCSEFATRRAAEAEQADYEEGEVRQGEGFRPSAKLQARWKRRFSRRLPTGDLAREQAILAVLEGQKRWDGVWWADRYDPVGLSAPRGLIFENAQAAYEKCALDGPLDRWRCPPRVATAWERYLGV